MKIFCNLKPNQCGQSFSKSVKRSVDLFLSLFFPSHIFLIAAGCPRNSFYTPSSSRKCNRLLNCALNILVLGTKTPAKTRQNSCQKQEKFVPSGTKLMPKGGKLTAKVFTACSSFFFLLYTQKFVLHTKKISFVLQKIAFVLQKQQLAHFFILKAYFIAFGTLSHTFPYFLSFQLTVQI